MRRWYFPPMAWRKRCRSTPSAAISSTFDATCPLVTKVHREAEIHFRRGREILLIGHAGHPEVVGTLGQLPEGSITLIQTMDDARSYVPTNADNLAYVTQTTLSIDDTAEIADALKERFPSITIPHKEDICYATTNRQEAVKKVAPLVQAMIVVGAPNSSNSQRLREVAERSGSQVRGVGAACGGYRLGQVRQHHLARCHRRRFGAGSAGRGSAGRLRRALPSRGRDRGRRRGRCVLPAAARAAASEAAE